MIGEHVLVTGGAGFIGSHLSEALLARGHRVTVLDDLSTGRAANLAQATGVRLLVGSVVDQETLRQAMSGVSVVFHLAAVPSVPRSVKEPLLSHQANATGTLTVLETARECGVERVVYAASSSAIGEVGDISRTETLAAHPRSPYAVAKYAGELYGRVYWEIHRLPVVSLRYFNVYGPRQHLRGAYSNVIPAFVAAALQGTPATIYGDGTQTRDFTYVADVVHSTLLAAEVQGVAGLTINVGPGNPVSIRSLAEAVAVACGRRLAVDFAPRRPEDVHDMKADTALARQLLGFVPSTPMSEGLAATAAWFAAAYAGGSMVATAPRA